jgi:hypothetical protein
LNFVSNRIERVPVAGYQDRSHLLIIFNDRRYVIESSISFSTCIETFPTIANSDLWLSVITIWRTIFEDSHLSYLSINPNLSHFKLTREVQNNLMKVFQYHMFSDRIRHSLDGVSNKRLVWIFRRLFAV